MSKLRIDRAASDGDLADVVAVRTAVARPWETGPEVEQLRHHLTTSPRRRLNVARLDGEPVGCASAGSAVPGDPSEELPAQANVLPAYRRRGIGSALLRETSAYPRAGARRARDRGLRGRRGDGRPRRAARLSSPWWTARSRATHPWA